MITLQGMPCGEVVSFTTKSDNDHVAVCKDGNRYHVFVNAQAGVVVESSRDGRARKARASLFARAAPAAPRRDTRPWRNPASSIRPCAVRGRRPSATSCATAETTFDGGTCGNPQCCNVPPDRRQRGSRAVRHDERQVHVAGS